MKFEEILVIIDEFNEDVALEAAAHKAAEIHQNAIDECEEYYNGDDLDDCRQDPNYEVSEIKVILANNDHSKTKEYRFDIYTAINEARLLNLI